MHLFSLLMFGFLRYEIIILLTLLFIKNLGLEMRMEMTYVCHVIASLMAQWIIFVMQPPASVNAMPGCMGQNVMLAPISLQN